MNPSTLFLLALGLSADATAAAATRGIAVARLSARHVLLVMAWFGVAQGGMAFAGSLLGVAFGSLLAAWDHWIAFGLLSALGVKMIWEARGELALPEPEDAFATSTMLLLAFATSIDALAVGVTLPLLAADVALACLTIGVVTALMSAFGLWAGRRFGAAWGRRVDMLGGVLLIALGAKILFEHLSQS